MNNEELIEMAKKVKVNAFAYQTGYKVGAAVLSENNKIYLGVNVEEKCLPNLSICAERNAFQNAFTYGERNFLKIALVGGMGDKIDETLTPCGICLQYMLDLCPNIKIVVYINGIIEEKSLQDFISVPFILNDKK
ncbi:MAG: cytidine deaminase [Clostridia bacterium]|nr:cytidine deaminase [Clostridia bacterium]MDD4387531.1 cytidine deaminase [Clostridia bacterium]